MVQLLAILGALIFADVTPPQSARPSVSQLQITAELASGELRAGGSAMFRVRIRNTGNVDQKIGSLKNGDFLLKTDKGSQQWSRNISPHWRCAPAGILKPNETIVYLVDLSGVTLSGSGSLTLDLNLAYLDGTCVAQPVTWTGPVDVAAVH